MFLTLETLEQYRACESGKKWFARHFPEGGELIDVISHKYVTPEILHWGYTHLTTTEEEREIYWQKLNIDVAERWTIYESDHIVDSSYVTRSSKVRSSSYIFSCKDVVDSNNISGSKNIERSRQVFNGEFVYDSEKVYLSKNINQSLNVINSDYVVRSSSILNCAVITNSHYVHSLIVGRTKQIKDSAFITDCYNLKSCLFCTNIHDSEYMLFNQPIDPDQFDMIMKQMQNIMSGWQADFVKEEWPEETIPLDSPQLQRNVIRQFENLPEVFWRWVKTLPGYDPGILYAITFQTNLI